MGKLEESNRGKLLEKPLGSRPRYTLYFCREDLAESVDREPGWYRWELFSCKLRHKASQSFAI